MTPKKISLVIALCMLFNNTAIAGAVDAPVFEVTAPIIQTSVFQLASLVRLPFTLTSKLISEEAPLLPEYKRMGTSGTPDTDHNNKKEHKAVRDSGFFFTNSEKDLKSGVKTGGTVVPALFDRSCLAQMPGALWVNLLFFWLGFKYIFLFACLLALSKSNLPWELRDTAV